MNDFGIELFAGAAAGYAKYRVRYPRALFADLAELFGLDGHGRLLDLGCGTGELAIPLAGKFSSVLALDPDADMLAVGSAKAQKLGITNISWQKGSSKELNSLEGQFKLVVMGQSFHWMDQEQVIDDLYTLIEEGGGLAIIAKEPVQQGPTEAKKDEIIQKLIKRYVGPKRRAGSGFFQPPAKKYEQWLPGTAFKNFERRYYDVKVARDIDQVLGNLFSHSWANKNLFGSQLGNFEADLRRELKALNGRQKFHDKARFSLYTLTK